MELIRGKVLVSLGDHIDTDLISPGKFLTSYEPEYLGSICLCEYAPDFREKVRAGGLLIAGKNFGCGSSRETAPIALQAAGVRAVIAEEFARIFYRNAINVGLPCIECPDTLKSISVGDEVEVDLAKGIVVNITKSMHIVGEPASEKLIEILEGGGLMANLKSRLLSTR